MRAFHVLTTSAVLLPTVALMAWAGAPTPQGKGHPSAKAAPTLPTKAAALPTVSFRDTVEPYFKAHCTACHNTLTHTSGFDLEATNTLFKGGSKFGSKVIVPGNPRASALVAYLRGLKQPQMPLNGEPAPEPQIKLIEAWVAQGANIDPVKTTWPYTSPVPQAVPSVKNSAWVRTPIDNFVLAKLEAKGLKPGAPASRIALLRRIYADLIGIPPTPREADAFLNDNSPKAYESLVDKL